MAIHHLIDRRLWEESAADMMENAVALCAECRARADQTTLSPAALREAAGIARIALPEHLDPELAYDKWGSPCLPNGTRLRGELFYERDVQELLAAGGVLGDFLPWCKYPRTLHFPWSPNLQNDDRLLTSLGGFEGEEVVATLKLDGENTTMYRGYIHARSLDSKHHPSRDWVKALHGRIAHEIPEDFRICGENLFGEHSLHYGSLPDYFAVFNIWERGDALDWDATVSYCEMLGLHHVPVLWRGMWDEKTIRDVTMGLDPAKHEGTVVRVTRAIKAGEWKRVVGKCVRSNHVTTDQFWMTRPVVPNGLAKTLQTVSYDGRPA